MGTTSKLLYGAIVPVRVVDHEYLNVIQRQANSRGVPNSHPPQLADGPPCCADAADRPVSENVRRAGAG